MKGKNTLLGIVASSGILLSCNSNLKTETEVYKPSDESIIEKENVLENKMDIGKDWKAMGESYSRKIEYFKEQIKIHEEYTRKLEEEIIPKYVETREKWESLTNK